MNFRCTISNIDDDSRRYLMGIIDGMRARDVVMTPDTIEFATGGTNMALLVDLHQREILRCDISYGRITNTI